MCGLTSGRKDIVRGIASTEAIFMAVVSLVAEWKLL
jgi:hypothetical protein